MSTLSPPDRRLSIPPRLGERVRQLAPGVALASVVAVAALLAEGPLRLAIGRLIGAALGVPAIVLALILGMALHGLAQRPALTPGVQWCVKVLLRIAVGLLGVRIALGDIVGLGLGTASLIVIAMAATLAGAVWLARRLGLGDGFGALAGAATAVCGASATLATAAVLPASPTKERDVVFTVVMANAVSTLVMIAYPPLCLLLGLGATETGIVLGGTIHDMAQVVGAGYAVSEPIGNTAVIVKMLRVFLLLPVVLSIAWWLHSGTSGERPGVPFFALAFLGLCLLNSLLLALPGVREAYLPVRQLLSQVSAAAMLVAIAALGLGTSLAAITAVGWRHLAVFMAATVAILAIVLAGVVLMA